MLQVGNFLLGLVDLDVLSSLGCSGNLLLLVLQAAVVLLELEQADSLTQRIVVNLLLQIQAQHVEMIFKVNYGSVVLGVGLDLL